MSVVERIGWGLGTAGLMCLQWGCATSQRLDPLIIRDLHKGQTAEEVQLICGSPKVSQLGSNRRKLELFAVFNRKEILVRSKPFARLRCDQSTCCTTRETYWRNSATTWAK
jgi:hypothetical protein